MQGTSKNGKVIDFTEKFHGGSTVEENQELVAQIVDLAVEHNVDLETQWIPREENVRADASTHISAVHDFKLRDEIFRRVDEKWGEHTIDRFACPGNVRVKSGFYNSRFLEPGMTDCRGIDALAQSDWGVHNNYVHPPYMLLAPTIYTIRRTDAKATLVCPMWKGSVLAIVEVCGREEMGLGHSGSDVSGDDNAFKRSRVRCIDTSRRNHKRPTAKRAHICVTIRICG